MQYELTGRIKLIHDKQTFGSGFEKREFVVTTQEKYPQEVKLELTGDRIDLVSNYNVGDTVTVKFNIRGNEYNGRHFVNLRAWDVTGGGAEAQPQGQAQSAGAMPPPPPAGNMPDDDLPF